MRAEQFLKKEYGIDDRLANLDLNTDNGKRNYYLTSLMERYAENEIESFIKFISKTHLVSEVVVKHLEQFIEAYNDK